jgi:hypothetical protein
MKLEQIIKDELKSLGFTKKDTVYRYSDVEIYDISSDDYSTTLSFTDSKSPEHSHYSLSFCKDHTQSEVRKMMLALTAMKGNYENVSYIFFESEL